MWELSCPACGDGTIRAVDRPARVPTIPPRDLPPGPPVNVTSACPECARAAGELEQLFVERGLPEQKADVSSDYKRQVPFPVVAGATPCAAIDAATEHARAESWLFGWRGADGAFVAVECESQWFDAEGKPTVEQHSPCVRTAIGPVPLSLEHRVHALVRADLDLTSKARGSFDDRELDGGVVVAPQMPNRSGDIFDVPLARRAVLPHATPAPMGLFYQIRCAGDELAIASRPTLAQLKRGTS
jgi:hypothetical protein